MIERGIWHDGIGGTTYPPTLGVLIAPLGWLPPSWAQWVVVEVSVLLVLIAAMQVSCVTSGRVPWEAAALATLSFPSFFLAMGVGQNSALSLLIFVLGWSLLVRDHDILAGAVFGLFALKPTWGVAIAWIPAVVGRPRAYIGMALASATLVAVTLPVCGVQAWFDWLKVAAQTEHYYHVLPRWAALSRDLPGLLRRFEQGSLIEFAGWAEITLVLGITAWTWRARRTSRGLDATGPRAVTLLAGAILTCPRFMFYDMTLVVFPVLIGFAKWAQMTRMSRLVFAALVSMLWIGTGYSYVKWAMLGPPLDTFALIGLWGWGVVQVHARQTPRKVEMRPVADRSGSESEMLASTV